MIEFAQETRWAVTTHRDGSVDGWAVTDSEEAGIGAAMLTIAEMFEGHDYTISPVMLGDNKWMLRGTSTLTGYPVPAEVIAYVLPVPGR